MQKVNIPRHEPALKDEGVKAQPLATLVRVRVLSDPLSD